MVVQTTSGVDLRVAIPADPIWRLSVAQYHQMIQAGILNDDDPVELLEGWLVTRMPKNPRHRLSTQLAREALARLLPAGWYVEDQEPITLVESEPEPNVAVIAGERRRYHDRHPGSGEVALVVEVSDTTLQRDRMIKQRIYARAQIPVYWIINLVEQQIEVYTLPSGDGDEAAYRQRAVYLPADAAPLVLEGQVIGTVAAQEILA